MTELVECKGRRVLFRVEEKTLPNGYKMKVDRVIFPNAVAILPVIGEKIVLIKQYRPVIDKYILEAPAGVIDKGETPEEAALRELAEETGFRARELVRVGSGYVSPGYSTEKLYLYLAPNPEPGESTPEEHEIIRNVEVSLGDAMTMISTGEISDVKTILLVLAAYYYVRCNKT